MVLKVWLVCWRLKVYSEVRRRTEGLDERKIYQNASTESKTSQDIYISVNEISRHSLLSPEIKRHSKLQYVGSDILRL